MEEVFDVLFADEFGGQKVVEIEVGEAAIRDARRKHLEEQLRIDWAKGANFFKDDALGEIDELGGINEAAKLDARHGLYKYGAEKTEEIAFSGGVFGGVRSRHCSRADVASAGAALDAVAFVGVAGELPRAVGSCSRIKFSTRCQTFWSHSISM